MIKVNMREVEQLERQFQKFAAKAYPHATKAYLNNAAFLTRGAARNNIRKSFILRNHWTDKGVQVEKTNTLKVADQVSRAGSRDPYMARQEFGGVLTKKGGVGKPIYTAVSAGLPEGTRPVKKLPVKRHRLGPRGSLKIVNKSKGTGSANQRAMIAVKQAQRAGLKHVYLDLPKAKGLFTLKGSGKHARVSLVHDLSRDSVRTPPEPWLIPAWARVNKVLPNLWRKTLIEQARRNRLFGY